ncbi:NepR family anti-sigma factor [Aminobacter sp. BE322]|uniref:NepR family anti-sigma factor n=1 Tax=unclassified Aminobacter TaxID=2644704 RepID=UPI003D1930C8
MTRQTSGAPNAQPNRRGDGDLLGTNSEIGRKLKQYYDELVSDDVPDRFAQLLSQLEEAEPAQQKD